jgi:hypothetical protein
MFICNLFLLYSFNSYLRWRKNKNITPSQLSVIVSNFGLENAILVIADTIFSYKFAKRGESR